MFELEDLIQAHEDVLEATAFGVATPETESVAEAEIMALVVLKRDGSIGPRDIVEYVGARAPKYLVPRFVEIVESLPRNSQFKVQKNELRKRGLTSSTWDRLGQGRESP